MVEKSLRLVVCTIWFLKIKMASSGMITRRESKNGVTGDLNSKVNDNLEFLVFSSIYPIHLAPYRGQLYERLRKHE